MQVAHLCSLYHWHKGEEEDTENREGPEEEKPEIV